MKLQIELVTWPKPAARMRVAAAYYTLWAPNCHSVQLTVYRGMGGGAHSSLETVGRAFWNVNTGWQAKPMVTRKQAAQEIRAHRNMARRGQDGNAGAERTH